LKKLAHFNKIKDTNFALKHLYVLTVVENWFILRSLVAPNQWLFLIILFFCFLHYKFLEKVVLRRKSILTIFYTFVEKNHDPIFLVIIHKTAFVNVQNDFQ
jgi:hypothetical protein